MLSCYGTERQEGLVYHPYLPTFVTVAQQGSISKAAERLYISPTGVMKQMNRLETDLGVKLVNRSNRGIDLTEAGKMLLEDAKHIIQYSNDAVRRAIEAAYRDEYFIRIGTSLMNPAQAIGPMLNDISSRNSRLLFRIVSFNDYRDEYERVIRGLGEEIDVVAGVYGFSTWTQRMHQTLRLYDEPICIAVPSTHELASRNRLHISDLRGQRLFVPSPGDSSVADAVREELEARVSQVEFVDVRSYDMNVINLAGTTNNLLLTTPRWAALNPMLKSLSVDWGHVAPFGLVYPAHPSEGVRLFVQEVERLIGRPTAKE